MSGLPSLRVTPEFTAPSWWPRTTTYVVHETRPMTAAERKRFDAAMVRMDEALARMDEAFKAMPSVTPIKESRDG
jgi:hypothetical protein